MTRAWSAISSLMAAAAIAEGNATADDGGRHRRSRGRSWCFEKMDDTQTGHGFAGEGAIGGRLPTKAFQDG
jgi:hypothetical protein